jgi:hypothetical protein
MREHERDSVVEEEEDEVLDIDCPVNDPLAAMFKKGLKIDATKIDEEELKRAAIAV